ncbi:MAG: IclR family transcriptional regulator [Pseudonocardia sp. SCN 72-86]|nr:MAG: IclR family transcriptional regulator [Pseudonocardia sp. SCN 72-86]
MIQSVDRAVRILTALQGARRMGLGELATQLELAPSTVHGIVRTLLDHGMIAQERDSGRYRLGPATLRLGNVYLDTLELRSRSVPWAEDLATRTGMAVRTAVLLAGVDRDLPERDVIVVAHEPRPGGGRQMNEVGIVVPAHACALGKALLAFDDTALPDTDTLRSMTGETITDPARLRAELAAVRAAGIATEAEEAVLGEYGVAAPVGDHSGAVAGAIGLVVTQADWPLDPAAADALRAAARSISRELGAPSWPPAVTARPAASA